MIKKLKERVVDNWITSVAGILLGGFMGFLLYQGKITFDNFCYILPTVLLLLGVKDTIVGVIRQK